MQSEEQHKEVIGRVLGLFSELTAMQDFSETYMQDFYKDQNNSWIPEFNDNMFHEIYSYILDKMNMMQEIQQLLTNPLKNIVAESVVEPFVPPIFENHRSLTSNKHRTYAYSYPTSVDISRSCILYPPLLSGKDSLCT